MSRYMVECSIGTIWLEVEADTADDAIDKAIDEWDDDATAIIHDGRFSVRELKATEL